VALVRERVDSPMESRLRMLIVLAGLPEPRVNVTYGEEDGLVLRRYDLSWPEVRVIVEYDGRHHVERVEQWESDLERREAIDDARVAHPRGRLVWHLREPWSHRRADPSGVAAAASAGHAEAAALGLAAALPRSRLSRIAREGEGCTSARAYRARGSPDGRSCTGAGPTHSQGAHSPAPSAPKVGGRESSRERDDPDPTGIPDRPSGAVVRDS
jgi:hypothetical protein